MKARTIGSSRVPAAAAPLLGLLLVLAAGQAGAQRGGRMSFGQRGFGGGGMAHGFGGGTHFQHGGSGLQHSRPGPSFGPLISGGVQGPLLGPTDRPTFLLGAPQLDRHVPLSGFPHFRERRFHHGSSFFGSGAFLYPAVPGFGLSFGYGAPYYYDPFWDGYPYYSTPYYDYAPPAPPVVYSLPGGTGGGYYLDSATRVLTEHPGLAQAINDIEAAFRHEDVGPLERHVPASGKIEVMSPNGATRHVSVDEYLSMTRDAFKSMDTTSFTLDRVERAPHDSWQVLGVHELKRSDGSTRAYTVGFVLHESHDRWYITQVSAGPSR